MRSLQNDNYSVLAANVLPTMLKLVNMDRLNATQREAFEVVSKWNFRFDADEIGASIFEIWQKDAYNKVWDEFNDDQTPMRLPNRDRTVQLLLNEPNSDWFDNRGTPQKETRNDIIHAAFQFSVDSLQRKLGTLSKSWKWANVKHTNVPHLAKITGFGSRVLLNGGSKTSVNALNESNGPSWRMVVALGKPTRGYGVFPGGQSGNPGSFYYDDMIPAWTQGQLNDLLFLKSASDADKRIKTRLTLQKK
jgi:penicillin G amidase